MLLAIIDSIIKDSKLISYSPSSFMGKKIVDFLFKNFILAYRLLRRLFLLLAKIKNSTISYSLFDISFVKHALVKYIIEF